MLFSPANVFVLFLADMLCNIGLSSTGTGSGSSVPFVGTSVEFGRLDDGVESSGTSVEYADPTPPVRVSGICKLSALTPATIGLGISVERGNGRLMPAATVSGISWENGVLDPVVKLWEIIVGMFSCVGIPAPRGVGGFGGVVVGRSSVDPAPGVSTYPKRRFLGAVVLRDRGRNLKLYPGPGGRAGTSEAEADPKPSGCSMDMC